MGLERVVLVTHDMGDTVGGELLARDLEGALPFSVERRVLTNGSIYIGMAQLSTGQQFLLALDDERADVGGSGERSRFGVQAGHRGHVRDRRTRRPTPSSTRSGSSRRTRTATRCCRARSATSRIGAPRRSGSPARSNGIRRRSVSCGARSIRSRCTTMTARLLAARPDATLITLDDVGHYPMVEDPDAFATAVLDLLT